MKRQQRQPNDGSAQISAQPAADAQTLSMGRLTGAGYEDDRFIACVVVPCNHRFGRAYDLEVHLEAVHGYPSLAAMEAAVEQEALSGGQFWLGGSEDENVEDADLALRLNRALKSEVEEDE